MWLFYHLNFERNYDVLKSNSLCFLLSQTLNFGKNKSELEKESQRRIQG